MIGKTAYIKEGPFRGRSGEIVATSPNGRYFVKISPSTIVSFDKEDFDMDEWIPSDELNKFMDWWIAVAIVVFVLGIYFLL